MFKINRDRTSLLLSLMILSTWISIVSLSGVKGMYYERRKASTDSIKQSTIATHDNLR